MLAIIIPTYDSLDTLKVLLKNIEDYTKEYRLYVIEDGQKQETIDWLKENQVNTIFHAENKGVAPSWNDGLRQAIADGCDYFAIFNDDIEIPPNWWEDCQQEFKDDIHAVCLIGGPVPLTGWFFILDKYCIDKLGFFDEQFAPYYCEDDDYFTRMRFGGIRLMKLDLNVFHHGSTTLKKLKAIDMEKYETITAESRKRLRKKYPYLRL